MTPSTAYRHAFDEYALQVSGNLRTVQTHMIRVVPEEIAVFSAGFMLWEYEKSNPVA